MTMVEASRAVDPAPMRVLYIDDQVVVRAGLSQILNETGEYIVAEVNDVDDALRAIENRGQGSAGYQIIIFAGSMSSQLRIDSVLRLRQANRVLPILIIDDAIDAMFAREVMKRGASGYISRQSETAEFIEALQRLGSGRRTRYLSNDVARLLAVSALSKEVDPLSTLTTREYEVFTRLSAGQAVGHIAIELKLTSKTISNHRLSILKKLGVKSTVELAHLSMRRGMIPPSDH